MHDALTEIARRGTAHTQMRVADAGSGLVAALRHRAEVLGEHAERGAQAAEYAMLGGVSAAACTGLVAILKNKDTLKTLVETLLSTLGTVVEGWF